MLLEKYLQGGVRKSLPYNLFKNIDILIPSFKEQQKIAYFLSSVDELIIEQVKKLEKLKIVESGKKRNWMIFHIILHLIIVHHQHWNKANIVYMMQIK